jgi:uncharacterized membrane protein YjfL (UPF0719 family)
MGSPRNGGIDPANQVQSLSKDLNLLAILHSLIGIFASGISGLFGYKSILSIILQIIQGSPSVLPPGSPSTFNASIPEVRVVGSPVDLMNALGTSISPVLLLGYFLIISAAIVGLYRLMADLFGSQGQKIRIFLLLGLLGYGIGSVIQGYVLGSFSLTMFRPGVRPILLSLCTLWVGYTSIQIMEVLTARELFIKTFSQIPQGDLLQRLQEEHPWILRLQDQIRWLNSLALSLMFSPVIVFLGLALLNPHHLQGVFWPLISLGMVFHGMILLGLGNTYLDDHRSLAHTVLMPLEQRTLRLTFGGILIGLAVVFGSLLPGRTSLIPTTWITGFLAWLASIFTPRTQWEIEQEILDRFMPQSPPAPVLDPDYVLEAFELAKLLQQLMEILRRALVIGAVVGILFFLLYPLLNTKAFRRWLRELQAGTSRTIFGRIISMAIRLAAFIQASWKRLFPPSIDQTTAKGVSQFEQVDVSIYLKSLHQKQKSRRKPSDTLLMVLEEYLQWGLELGGVLTKSTTLLEFSKTLSGLSDLERIQEQELNTLFNQLLYDGSVTISQESILINEAKSKVKDLIKKERPSSTIR